MYVSSNGRASFEGTSAPRFFIFGVIVFFFFLRFGLDSDRLLWTFLSSDISPRSRWDYTPARSMHFCCLETLVCLRALICETRHIPFSVVFFRNVYFGRREWKSASYERAAVLGGTSHCIIYARVAYRRCTLRCSRVYNKMLVRPWPRRGARAIWIFIHVLCMYT